MPNLEVSYTMVTCAKETCNISFPVDSGMINRLKQNHKTFYCPHGHSQWYPQRTDEDILREQAKEKDRKINALQAELDAKKKKRSYKRKIK